MKTKIKSALCALTVVVGLADGRSAFAQGTGVTNLYNNFSDVSSLQLNGNASAPTNSDGYVLQVTPAAFNQVGSAFLKTPISVANDASFSTFFSFRFSQGSGPDPGDTTPGADGIAFMVVTATNSLSGGTGGSVGHVGIPNSLAVEFDTYFNGAEVDINGNHVAIHPYGNAIPDASAPLAEPLNNGQVWYSWIDYDGVTGQLEVRISTSTNRPASPALAATVNLLTILGTTNAFFGFAGSTGGSYNQQDVLTWQMTVIQPPGLVSWTGASGTDLLWTSPGNWSPLSIPAITTGALFADAGVSNDAVSVNNIVSASQTAKFLSYSQTSGFHHTLIAPGTTLTIRSNLLAGTETITNIIVTNRISGAGAALVVGNGSASSTLIVRQAGAAGGAHRATLDLSGLDTFTANVGRVLVGVGIGGHNRATGRLILARTNVITATSATAPAIDIGDSDSNGGTATTWVLGQRNVIAADTITFGRGKEGSVNVFFNSASSSASFRGANGTGRVSTFAIADGSTITATVAANATANFSGGTVDALIGTLVIARGSTALNTVPFASTTGTLVFDQGVIDANTVLVGANVAANTNSGNGTITVKGTALLVVNGVLELGRTVSPAAGTNTSGTVNIFGGTVRASSITNAGTGVATVSIDGGNLILSNTLGSAAAPVSRFFLTNATLQLSPVAGITTAIVSNLVTGGATNTIQIASLNSDGQFQLIKYVGTFDGTGFNFILGTLPAPFVGYLSNNLANSSIDFIAISNSPPAITTQPQSLTNNAGTTASFSVTVTGTAPLSFQWEKNGLTLMNGDNVSGATTDTLTLTGVAPNDAANYTVEVTNAIGLVVSMAATLTVIAPDIAVQQPAGTDLVDGADSIGFGSVILGSSSAPKTFTVINSGSASLVLTNITKDGANASDFSVSASGSTNLAPGASTTFTVTFTPGVPGLRSAALHITNNDDDGNPFDITLNGTGTGVFDTFGYTQLPAAFAFENISGTGTRVLTNADSLAAAATIGFGFNFYGRNYTNLSFNAKGLVTLGGTTASASNVNLTNQAPTGNFPSIAVLWDDWCTLTNGNPGVDAIYYQTLGTPGDRRFIVQWNNIFGFPTSPSSVTFQAILFETNGNILCQYPDVNSANGRSNGASATVGIRDTDGHLNGKNLQWSFNQAIITNSHAILFAKVATDPSITAHPQNRTNVAGTTATFVVSATGTGALAYQWQRNGLTFADGGNVSGASTSTLTLSNVTLSSAANYTVAVTNANGKVVSVVARLTIGLAITSQPQNQTNVVGGNSQFFVNAIGNGLTYQWQTNSINIPGATTSSYNAVNVQLADSGTIFTVVVSNSVGSITSAPAVLTVRIPKTLVVTTAAAAGAGSLRQAVLDATTFDSINFSNSLSGSTILLTNGEIILNKSLNVDASMLPNGITLDGAGGTRIFEVKAGQTVVLTALILIGGFDIGGGAGVYNLGTLTLNQSTFSGNLAVGGNGGAIYNLGTLTMNQSTFSGNFASRGGGAIVNFGNLTVDQSTLSGNSSSSGAGGIENSGSLYLVNSIVAGNASPDISGDVFVDNNNLTSGNPLLATLGNYGGPTPTMLPLPGSPAIDGCTNGAGFTTDQRGFPRVVGANADIGAVELGVPIIITQPQSRTNFLGASTTLSVTATGVSPLSYQWVFNGTNLSGATNASYIRTYAQFMDAGNYFVVLTNSLGTLTSSVATLSVVVDPSAVVTIDPNLPVTYPVAVYRSPGEFFAFYNNNFWNSIMLTNVELRAFPPTGRSTNVSDEIENYSVVMTGRMVSPVFGDYPFTASGSAQTIVHKKAANTTGEFDTEMLSMSLSGAIPEGLFMIRESPTLPSLGHSLIADLGGGIYGSSSSFDHVFTELLMEGSASWEPDFSYSGNIILVQAQPFITNQPQSQSVSAGSNVTFRVTAVGETPLTYQWQFNSTNISGASGTNYIRANSQSMDAGAYTVVVTNNFGSVTSAIATLTVTNANPDADGNGLPDAWEQQYFGHTGVDPNADADGEGMSNLREFLAGTNPTNAASVFRILSAVPTNNDVQVDWTTVGGHSYVLQSVTNLTMSFQDISPTNSVGGTNEGTTNYLHNGGATNPAGFYRVRLEP